MDAQSKTGKVYLQLKTSGKKWKPVWLSLFPSSCSGVGRLELQDGAGLTGDGSPGVRRHQQAVGERRLKVVRLSELITVLKLPPNAEACPMENMCAFCVETQERTMVFAAPKDDCAEWVDKLCQSTFQRADSNNVHVEENQIYASADAVSEFWVTVQRTAVASRCGLQGSYWLQVGHESLLLRDKHKSMVREWPYELLRRYGKDKMTLSIEAGRRCDSGPGTFIFETQQADRVFSLIQTAIKRKTGGSPNPEADRGAGPNTAAHSPLPRIPDMTSMVSILENQLRTQDRKPREDPPEKNPTHPAPITLMPLPSVPTQDTPTGVGISSQSEAVYADPADCVQSVTTALYVDPASVLPLKPPANTDSNISPRDSDYSEVFDRISPVPHQPHVVQGLRGAPRDEPIYTEPTTLTPTPKPPAQSKSDPFAHLYAQVCKRAPPPPASDALLASSASSSTCTPGNTTDESSDIIYENLGVI